MNLFKIDAASTTMYTIKSKNMEQQLQRQYAIQLFLNTVPAIDKAFTIASKMDSVFGATLRDIKWEYKTGNVMDLFKAGEPITVELREMRSNIGGLYEKGKIIVNSRKLDAIGYDTDKNVLALREIIGTIMHEYAHAKGFFHGTGWFRNFRTKHKEEYSVPYWLTVNGTVYVDVYKILAAVEV